MRNVFLTLIPLLFAQIAVSAPTLLTRTIKSGEEFVTFLNWNHEMSKVYSATKSGYANILRIWAGPLYSQGYDDMPNTLSTLFDQMEDLRTLLVKGEHPRIRLINEANDTMSTLMKYLMGMVDVFEDLKTQVDDWETRKEGGQVITAVTDDVPLEWFMKHGFREDTLQNATIEQVKHLVDQIVGHDKPMHKVLQFFATAFFLEPHSQLGGILSWIAKFGGSADAVASLAEYIRSLDIQLPETLIPEIVELLTQLGDHEGILCQFIGNENDDGMYTYYLNLVKYATLNAENNGNYLSSLIEMCQNLQAQLKECKQVLLSPGYEIKISYLKTDAMYADQNTIRERKLVYKIDSLVARHGLITRLCNAMNQLENSIDEAHKGWESEISGNLRS